MRELLFAPLRATYCAIIAIRMSWVSAVFADWVLAVILGNMHESPTSTSCFGQNMTVPKRSVLSTWRVEAYDYSILLFLVSIRKLSV